MPIQPIDLQTLFAHINQVGKDQAVLKEGLSSQQAAHAEELIKETMHQDESVNKSGKTDEDNQKINDEDNSGDQGEQNQRKEKDTPPEEKKKINVFTDPDLGRNIDISG